MVITSSAARPALATQANSSQGPAGATPSPTASQPMIVRNVSVSPRPTSTPSALASPLGRRKTPAKIRVHPCTICASFVYIRTVTSPAVMATTSRRPEDFTFRARSISSIRLPAKASCVPTSW